MFHSTNIHWVPHLFQKLLFVRDGQKKTSSYSSSLETFKEIKKLGFIVSLGGVTTFKNAKNSTNLIQNMELDDFVLETDCPYLTPEPFRGKCINEPKFVKYTAQHIADVKEISLQEVLDATNNNVYKLFKKVGK